jgi:PPOX class probable FMN-dependent enzyme
VISVAAIENIEQLRAIIGEPSELVLLKLHRQLNAQAREFIARSPMFLLSTADAAGQPTVAPKGDRPGFVRVADERTLLIPERKGNKLVFSLQNLLANPKVGLIFLLPGTGETLRVSGNAQLLDDPALCQSFIERGKPALLVTRVRVTQCYFHCAKAFLRAELWKPEAWADPMKISFGEEIAEAGGLATSAIDEFDAGVQERYKTDL